MKADLGTRLRAAGFIGLVVALVFYAIAVDGGWYRVDGVERIAAETHGMLRWRFVAHALGLANGGMRDTSWVFLVFPVFFWGAFGTLVAGSILRRRGRRKMSRLEWALSRLEQRSVAPVADRGRRLNGVLWRQLGGFIAGVFCIVCFHSAPKAEDLRGAQIIAGNWAWHLVEMRDDQKLVVFKLKGRFGDFVSIEEARAFEDEVAREISRIERSSLDPETRGTRLALLSFDTPELLTRDQVLVRTANAREAWQAALDDLDRATLGGAAFGLLFAGLLWRAWTISRRLVAAGFRGFEPEAEDPLYPRYAQVGNAALVGAVMVLVLGLAGTRGAQPAGIAFAVVGIACAGAVSLLACGLTLRAPMVLARARDPRVAAAPAVALHDQRFVAEATKLEAQATAKQVYAATLQAAGSPPPMIAEAAAAAHQLHAAAAASRSRILGGVLANIQARLTAANTQIQALRSQGAPSEAFGAVNAAAHHATEELKSLAYAAGWEPWPLQAFETATPAPAAAVMAPPSTPAATASASVPPPEQYPPRPAAKGDGPRVGVLMSTGISTRVKVLAVVVGLVVVGGAAVVTKVATGRGSTRSAAPIAEPAPAAAPTPPTIVTAVEVTDPWAATARASEPIEANGPASGCDDAMDEYEGALIAARDTASALEQRGCAMANGLELKPTDQLTDECSAIWRRHSASVSRAIEVQKSTRAACPGSDIRALEPPVASSVAARTASTTRPSTPSTVADLSHHVGAVAAAEAAPRSVEASASSTHKPGAGYTFVPSNLTDGDLATSWQTAKGAHGPHWVRLDFARAITITAVDIANGFQVQDRFGDEFTLNSRIATGRLRFSDGSEQPIAFDSDAEGYTRFPVADVTTNSVTILIDSEHLGTKWHDVAVSEVVVIQPGADE